MAGNTFLGLSATGLSLVVLLAGCPSGRAPVPMPDAGRGAIQFRSYCAACHQYDGQGAGDAPPLDSSPWVTGSENRLIKIVLHGVRGPMEVSGMMYDREMPGFGSVLSDQDMAGLLTYVRRRFGGPGEPITPASVNRVRSATPNRSGYWTVEELLRKP